MEQRIIQLAVRNEYILGAGVEIGAVGSHDEVLLELDFRGSRNWHGLTKKAIFYDALGENPTTILLTTNLLAQGQTEVYYLPVPYEAKTVAGDSILTLEGVEVDGESEKLRIVTREATFRVLPSKRYFTDPAPVTPTQAEQLQAEIDEIKTDIVIAAESAEAAKDSEEAAAKSEAAAANSANAAESSSMRAQDSATAAAGSAAEASNSAVNAASSAETALGQATLAEVSANAASVFAGEAANKAAEAKKDAAAAAGSAETAAEKATLAGLAVQESANYATRAEQSAVDSQNAAENAEASVSDAAGYASAAAGNASSAARSAARARTSEDNAAAALQSLLRELDEYLPKSGGTMTGDLDGRGIAGTSLRVKNASDIGSAVEKVAVFGESGTLHYRTMESFATDIAAVLPTWSGGDY